MIVSDACLMNVTKVKLVKVCNMSIKDEIGTAMQLGYMLSWQCFWVYRLDIISIK